MNTIEDYRKDHTFIGPPLPLKDFSDRMCEMVRELAARKIGPKNLLKEMERGVSKEWAFAIRIWKRYVGGLTGGEQCSCGDVAEACGGARGKCRHFGARPGQPPVP